MTKIIAKTKFGGSIARFASIFQPGGFITLVEMEELHGIIGAKAFRAGLDGPMNPVLGLIGVAEFYEKPAEINGIIGIAGIGRHCLSEPSDRFAVIPRNQPIMKPKTPKSVGKARIDIERFLIPR